VRRSDISPRLFAARLRELVRQSRQVEALPASGRAARLARAKRDPAWFARTYLPHWFGCGFAACHRRMFRLASAPRGALLRMVTGPREHGKSSILTVAEPLRRALCGVSKYIVMGSEKKKRAQQFLRGIRMELRSNPRILADFGRQRGPLWNRDEIILANGVMLAAKGRGDEGWRGMLESGLRPDFCVLDDIESRRGVRSNAVVQERVDWILGEVLGAVNGPVVISGNRFSKRCAVVRLEEMMETGEIEFEHFDFRALDGAGRPVWPQRFKRAELEAKRRTVGTGRFNAEFMGQPQDEGAKIRAEWLRREEPGAEPSLSTLQVIAFCDPAFTKKKTSDCVAIVVCGFAQDGTVWTLDHFVRQASPRETLDAMYEFDLRYRPRLTGMEANALQLWKDDAFRDAERRHGYKLTWRGVVHSEAKEIRIERTLPAIERGELRILRRGDWKALYDQLLDFDGRGRFPDDGPDALAGCFELRRLGARRPGMRVIRRRAA